MKIVLWSFVWFAVSLGAVIGVAQHFAFGTPFTIWAMLSAWASGYTLCRGLWWLSEGYGVGA